MTSFRSSKSYVRFQPNFLYSNYDKLIEKSLFPTNGVLENDTIYLFEFNIKSDCINFDLKIGDGDQNVRKNILEIYQRHPRFFGKVNKKFSSKWHLSFQKQILSSEDYEKFIETGNEDEVRAVIISNFKDLKIKLKEYQEIMEKELA